MERRVDEEGAATIRAKILDDDGALLGITVVPDGGIAAVKTALRAEAQRLKALTIGQVITL